MMEIEMKRHGFGAVLLCLVACATPQSSQDASAQVSRRDVARYANDLLVSHYRADGPGAAVLVARGDTVLFRGARGEADVDAHTPLRPDSVFRIGSVTKQFTAAALLTLVEDGRVRLDDPLSRYLPDYPNGDHITLLQLLNHTSGVKTYSNLPGYAEGTIRQDFTTAQLIALFKDQPADFAPGSNWSYSNSGYALIGAVIEVVTGMPWHVYLEQRLFEPLGMHHTGYGHEPRFANQQVNGYAYEGDMLRPALPMSMTQPYAAGALVSNVDDLLIWNRALHEGRILRNETYTQMITPIGVAAQPEIGYGFGIFSDTMRGRPMLQHGGRIFGFISTLTYLPGPDITIVVLENDDARTGVEESDALSRRLAAFALSEPYPAPTPITVSAAALQEAEGVYRFDGEVVRTLRVVDGALTAQRDGRPRIVLTPIAADDFLYADGFNRIKLERDAEGRVVRARYFPIGEGNGDIGARSAEPLPTAPVALQLPRAALERLVGEYANAEVAIVVSLDGDVLNAQIAGQPAFALRPTSPTEFEVADTGATLVFPSGAAPPATAVIRQGGRETTLTRTP
jgi:D-alanyl-D-alanine carboxypeptidase